MMGRGITDNFGLGSPTVMYRHISPFTGIVLIGEQLAHEILQGEATLLEDARLSVLARNYIFRM